MGSKREWYTRMVGDKAVMIDHSENDVGTGRKGCGHICMCVNEIIPQQKMAELSSAVGYNPAGYGPLHGIKRGETKEGKKYTFWKVYSSCE